jgi:membrane protein implicated in regulation of membrane protease activity
MEQMFLLCAAIGGTIFICQFVMALIGFGSEDVDMADDVPDDVGPDFADADVADDHGQSHGHGSTWLFGVISFRTVVAAITFFGMAGFASLHGGQSTGASLVIAILAGAIAMYGVHWLMRLLYRLSQDRTLRIERALGKRGKVYVPIPAQHGGAGKVQINLQDRLMEYAATTAAPETLPTGAQIVVTRVVSHDTVEVELVREPIETADE